MTNPTATTQTVQPPTSTPATSLVATTAAGTPTPPPAMYGTSTPRLLRGIRNVVIGVLLLFAGLTIVGTIAPGVALGTARDEVTYGMQLRNARATLAEADRRASVAFLNPTAAAGTGEWATYDSTLDAVSSQVVLAAAQHPGDAAALATVQTQINDYRRAVEAARAVALTNASSAATTYAATSTKLTPPLATLATLGQASDARVEAGAVWSVGIWAVVAAWVALVVLVLASVLIARRTRRVLNIGLVVGVVLVGIALALVSSANGAVQKSVTEVRTTSLTSARIHADTRTLAEQAKAAEGRTLLASGSGSNDYSQARSTLETFLNALPDSDPKTKQIASWQSYTTAHQALPGTLVDAKEQARTTTLKPLTTFVDSAKGLSASDTTSATDALSTAQQSQLPFGIAASLLCLLAIAAALWGITRRLTEYV